MIGVTVGFLLIFPGFFSPRSAPRRAPVHFTPRAHRAPTVRPAVQSLILP
jgi:hypothetical protein